MKFFFWILRPNDKNLFYRFLLCCTEKISLTNKQARRVLLACIIDHFLACYHLLINHLESLQISRSISFKQRSWGSMFHYCWLCCWSIATEKVIWYHGVGSLTRWSDRKKKNEVRSVCPRWKENVEKILKFFKKVNRLIFCNFANIFSNWLFTPAFIHSYSSLPMFILISFERTTASDDDRSNVFSLCLFYHDTFRHV